MASSLSALGSNMLANASARVMGTDAAAEPSQSSMAALAAGANVLAHSAVATGMNVDSDTRFPAHVDSNKRVESAKSTDNVLEYVRGMATMTFSATPYLHASHRVDGIAVHSVTDSTQLLITEFDVVSPHAPHAWREGVTAYHRQMHPC